jgi:putative ABC transport system permease protein
LVGIGLGISGALATSRVLKSLLFEVSATDPIVLLGVAAVLALTALAASYGPARNALRIDPVSSIKQR